ncbi:uncharacterized protein LOC143275736 [Babylonia areolata]|uniref:uncharacterized protein LOC143275736 n=1 Tax=Babylonia areolata TaxID=304850 RepID=UPI003FD2E1AF
MTMFHDRGSTVEEMAVLCGEGLGGWLYSSQLQWLADRANEQGTPALTVCVGVSTPDSLQRLASNHWVLATMDLTDHPVIMYCDSLGWEVPEDLLQWLAPYTGAFGIENLDKPKVIVMHPPSPSGHQHKCTKKCRNYPLQICSNQSDHTPNSTDRTTEYSSPKDSQTQCDHTSNSKDRLRRKRKTESSSHQPSKQLFHIRDDQTDTNTMDTHSGSSQAQASTGDTEQNKPESSISQTSHNHTTSSSEKNSHSAQSFPSLKKKWNCLYCDKNYGSKEGLRKHKLTNHTVEYAKHKSNQPTNCVCQDCEGFSCVTIQDLIQHYRIKHKKEMSIQTKEFNNETDFTEWKRKVEKDSKSFYTQASGTQKGKVFLLTHFYCHRSGKPELVKNRIRSMKSQGSCKIGHRCTSYITCRKNLETGTVTAEFCFEHTGHCLKLAHLNISSGLRDFIVGKLTQGHDAKTILDEIRADITHIDRDMMVTRKDILNIKKQFKISRARRDEDDAKSVYLWVEALKQSSDNPIIFYKRAGDTHDSLENEDFLLCIQNDFQRNIMLKYAKNIVCIDSTHGTTQYTYLLTTVLVLDDYQEAIPVAWAISNKEDAKTLKLFFSAIKNACGQSLAPQVFMSDLANNFYNAWCEAFEQAPEKRLYCSWHVDKAWRQKLREIFKSGKDRKDVEDECNIYACLKLLQMETDESKFLTLLQSALSFWEINSPTFHGYFHDNYCKGNKTKLWAACYRIGSLANTNMFAEAFHRVLKDVYFDKEQNRRIDDLLVMLLKIARDKAIDQFIKLERGKVTNRIREIRNRHKNANNVAGTEKTEVEGEWKVPSSSEPGRLHYVKKTDCGQCSCRLVCDFCHVCVHMYSCTCPDFLTKVVTCKHIHAVHMIQTTKQYEVNRDPGNSDENHTNFFELGPCFSTPHFSTCPSSPRAFPVSGHLVLFVCVT